MTKARFDTKQQDAQQNVLQATITRGSGKRIQME